MLLIALVSGIYISCSKSSNEEPDAVVPEFYLECDIDGVPFKATYWEGASGIKHVSVSGSNWPSPGPGITFEIDTTVSIVPGFYRNGNSNGVHLNYQPANGCYFIAGYDQPTGSFTCELLSLKDTIAKGTFYGTVYRTWPPSGGSCPSTVSITNGKFRIKVPH